MTSRTATLRLACAALAGSLISMFAWSQAAPAAPPSTLEKMKQFKVATTDLNIPPVPQGGANAAAIKENLKKVKLPPGFKIDLFAIVLDEQNWRRDTFLRSGLRRKYWAVPYRERYVWGATAGILRTLKMSLDH
jgi:hypothetical protein